MKHYSGKANKSDENVIFKFLQETKSKQTKPPKQNKFKKPNSNKKIENKDYVGLMGTKRTDHYSSVLAEISSSPAKFHLRLLQP